MGQKMKIGKIMIKENELNARVSELAEMINKDYGDRELVVIGVLKGCFVFMADLVKKLKSDVRVYFMEISSYQSGTVSSGKITIKKDLDVDIEGKDVLIAEDIIDSGNTLSQLTEILKERKPNSIKVCTLLSKPARRQVEFEADYTGFEIEDKFIIGYGLDCAEQFRQLPYIAEVELYD
ncbi:MAG: hypoxanthine phosphoribosyltransferase [Eubacteriales bacterium]|nr:hypoxanthine phosphoribosyltransferase [Eubacteriales bacterium]MDY4212720.1 hypoxanthine phosphoribosyltransferase [Eubacteriales bacterium]MDY5229819.1 hypoxanthine phosphoribosyltransferase [Eubacteriales bacterium]